MSIKDDLAVIEDMGVPVGEIVKAVKSDIQRASHKGADGKTHKPADVVVNVFVKEHLTAGHLDSVKAWIYAVIAKAAA